MASTAAIGRACLCWRHSTTLLISNSSPKQTHFCCDPFLFCPKRSQRYHCILPSCSSPWSIKYYQMAELGQHSVYYQASTMQECQATRIEQLYQNLFSGSWEGLYWRLDKVHAGCFHRKVQNTQVPSKRLQRRHYLIDSEFSSPRVQARQAAMGQGQEQDQQWSCSSTFHFYDILCGLCHPDQAFRKEQLWQFFPSDPLQWWDNRFAKNNLRYEDHKRRRPIDVLWIESWLEPPRVKSRLAQGRAQSGCRLRSPYGFNVGVAFGAPGQHYSRVAGDNVSFEVNQDISKLCQEGRLKEALQILDFMVQESPRISINALACVLRGCIKLKALAEGKRVHAHIIKSGYEYDIFLRNILVNMYANCGSLLDARQVFDKMPVRNVVSWTAIISAYAKQGQGEEAVKLFQQMQRTGMAPDKVVLAVVLKACASLASLEHGKRIHADVIRSGFESDVLVGSTLVHMYAKCGSIEDACQVFNKMHQRNVVSWTAMIAGYVQQGHSDEAFSLFERMQQEGVKPNEVTFASILRACASMADLQRGKRVHNQIMISGFELDVFVRNALIDMYAKCGSIKDACQVFNKMRERDVVSWNAMITGYAQQGHGKEAFILFRQMQVEGVKPDNVTFVGVLKACGSLAALEWGKQVHAQVIKSGSESNLFVGSTLVDMYAKCNSIDDARQVFNKMHVRDVVTWNALIAGYAQQGHGEEALILFGQMGREGVKPDDGTFVSVIKACASLAALEWGKQVHSHIIKIGLDSNVFIETALVDMYVKCRNIEDARQVFNKMHERNVVSWTAMIAGYSQQGRGEEALTLFKKMLKEGVKPNEVTFVNILKACANLAALEWGKQVNAQIVKSGYESNVFVGSALIDMYAKCGRLEDARQVFEKICERDAALWNAIIAAYAHQGYGGEALTLFKQMQQESIKPDEATFVCVLSACSHAGLIDEGKYHFTSMSQDHGITARVEHYACMVDLLGRVGHLDEAKRFINDMPIQPTVSVWTALLGACRSQGNLELGKYAFEHILKLEPKHASAYVLLSNIYAAAGRWGEVNKIRKEMEDLSIEKVPGCSWIEVNEEVHAFFAAGGTHPRSEEIQGELERLIGVMEEEGYAPNLNCVLLDISEEQKEDALWNHSEKLAIGFGLIGTCPGTPICINTNLRVCGDCHNATKFISKIVGREIIARDANSFHYFKSGVCSCGDYW